MGGIPLFVPRTEDGSDGLSRGHETFSRPTPGPLSIWLSSSSYFARLYSQLQTRVIMTAALDQSWSFVSFLWTPCILVSSAISCLSPTIPLMVTLWWTDLAGTGGSNSVGLGMSAAQAHYMKMTTKEYWQCAAPSEPTNNQCNYV